MFRQCCPLVGLLRKNNANLLMNIPCCLLANILCYPLLLIIKYLLFLIYFRKLIFTAKNGVQMFVHNILIYVVFLSF